MAELSSMVSEEKKPLQSQNISYIVRTKKKTKKQLMTESKSVECNLTHKEAYTRVARKCLPSRSSSFFRVLSQSFRRSNGERGADVETLRGIHGAAFEGYATVSRGAGIGSGCGCFRQDDSMKERYILVKGQFCFVFKTENAAGPRYAFSFAFVTAHQRKSYHGLSVVSLETALGDVEYEIGFSDEDSAFAFAAVADKQASEGEKEEIRKRLGHEHLIRRSKSSKYADKIATGKIAAQPKKKEELTAEDFARLNPFVGI